MIDDGAKCEFRYAYLRLGYVSSGEGGVLSLPPPGRLHRRNTRLTFEFRLANFAVTRIGMPPGQGFAANQERFAFANPLRVSPIFR